ncbi:MAG: SDR family oxidoreductase [Phenylobacterium sp.]|uniref:SDR family NAD(P)-dependent oxidoreductase n=1 Tax=Phenylobacterium sp. TaxID=1871053 RepID=UPI0025EBB559|nr:SDR family oxidoreductase [Phenylobacterium sp.]MCA6299259.1 SDR family oxidoreductase [Phenylobacterium sp.]
MAYRPFDLTGKVALVTGGNGGIGFGMVEALAQSGADVVIWGSNGTKNTAAAEALKDAGVRVLTQVVDVADENAVREGMAEAVRQMGRIDTVVANAGIGGGASSFSEFPTETYRRVLAVNLDGVFFTFREACKHMVERAGGGDKAGGSLVVISSLSAYDGAPRNEAYAATKGAVISMIRSIAVEHARYGVRANAVLPGWIATDMTAGAQGNDKFNDAVIRRVPVRRWGQPADFGGIAVYLASDASAFHTGDSFLIDGGYGIF